MGAVVNGGSEPSGTFVTGEGPAETVVVGGSEFRSAPVQTRVVGVGSYSTGGGGGGDDGGGDTNLNLILLFENALI